MSANIQSAVEQILKNIVEACERSNRDPTTVQLVAISKNQSVEKMQAVAMALRIASVKVIFGENYVQEYELKRSSVLSLCDESHFTGRLQSNKAALALDLFDMIETVHSEKIAEVLSKECDKRGIRRRVLLQVNVSSDQKKSGFDPKELIDFLQTRSHSLRGLDVEGLMTITAQYDDPERVRPEYRKLRELMEKIGADSKLSQLFSAKHLSMGMSSDFTVAIEEGATIVRIGSALFGSR